MLSKTEKKKKSSELRATEKLNFYEKLLISKQMFETLFYYLDEKLQEHGCKDNNEFTLQFLIDHAIDSTELIEWVKTEGPLFGSEIGCDCDMLWAMKNTDKIDAISQYYVD